MSTSCEREIQKHELGNTDQMSASMRATLTRLLATPQRFPCAHRFE
jgi:hypothetical protein